MSSRIAKILYAAKKKYNEDQLLEQNKNHYLSTTNEGSKTEIRDIGELDDLADNFLLDEALTPENINEIINTAELVFSVEENHSSIEENNIITMSGNIAETAEDIVPIHIITSERKRYILNYSMGDPFENHCAIEENNKLTMGENHAETTQDINSIHDNITSDREPHIVNYSVADPFNESHFSMDANQPATSTEENNDETNNTPRDIPINQPNDNENHTDDSDNEIIENAIVLRENNSLSRKKVKGIRNREINQELRLSGKEYLGFRKPPGQKNSFHDTTRSKRILGLRCKCIEKNLKSRQPKRRCYLVTEAKRKAIFDHFWSNMSWDQRKMFVAQSVTAIPTMRPKNSENKSRRSSSFQYSLTIENKKVQVCKQMYLHTTGLKEWSVRNWCLQSNDGLTTSNSVLLARRTSARNYHEHDTSFLKEFLELLNKLPSHYCRKDTDRLYLEQQFQSFADLHRVYVKKCEENDKKPQSIMSLQKAAKDMKISLFHPRKDICDVCFKYKNKNLTEEEYQAHVIKKNAARQSKQYDKEESIAGKCHVLTMDVQAVKLAPCLAASSMYYRTKLCNHNFTIYNLSNHKATCYWYDETNADGQAATYASFLVDYLEVNFLQLPEMIPVIIYSDGCTAQNRNCIMSNALLYLSEKYQTVIEQKFLEKGHTQMECDSVHATIESSLKHREIYLPSDYPRITREARLKNPYEVKTKPFNFFKNFGYKPLLKYKSIRPSNSSTVTDIRVLRYENGEISYKINYEDDFQTLPARPSKVVLKDAIFPQLYNSPLPITKRKFLDLQAIKQVIPQDCWSFYDSLPYK